MEFLYAQGPAQAGQPSLIASLLPLLILFAIFYFLVILPQQRQAKKTQRDGREPKKGR
jgi:preprotein translocase subunit YajC